MMLVCPVAFFATLTLQDYPQTYVQEKVKNMGFYCRMNYQGIFILTLLFIALHSAFCHLVPVGCMYIKKQCGVVRKMTFMDCGFQYSPTRDHQQTIFSFLETSWIFICLLVTWISTDKVAEYHHSQRPLCSGFTLFLIFAIHSTGPRTYFSDSDQWRMLLLQGPCFCMGL